jgi:hypothetical protein
MLTKLREKNQKVKFLTPASILTYKSFSFGGIGQEYLGL